MKYIKPYKLFESIDNLLIALCDCYEVGESGCNELERLLKTTSGKISDNDELVDKIFDIVITKNKTGGHKGPLMSDPHNRVEEIRDFIKKNETS